MSGRLEPFKQAQDYLPRLKAVFFGRWDEDKGCEITYQVPENSIRVTSTAPTITPSDSRASLDNDHPSLIDSCPQQHRPADGQQDQSKYLFEFTDVIDFILPKKHLCGHLVTVSSGSVKILGFPTLIEDEEKYNRNFFMFNLCFVFNKDSELLGYEPIIRKTGRVLRSLEIPMNTNSAEVSSSCLLWLGYR
ncbi:Nitrogen permease regulator 2 [Puccinia graminis f. sp. tritici]|uniref:Nitrogen permease regulator 2 n=1 Tax=Puccinia graminis f. sp. tritici TaxID=56615 RepID=A0A5B0M458_PUCGR|nr:Nitrogen permease regulator 2 [Puccinia graminis f. sp. tritici]KAA1071562.1 Nitrogen permease regulator 2 [Puccinia graminis f. sp. tritici]